jgi:CRP-like cAMP-binding protein
MLLQTFRKTIMFSGLPQEQLMQIANGCRLLSLAKNEFLFHAQEKVTGFYIVHHGAVSIHRVTVEGEEQVIRVFYPGESFGEVLLSDDSGYPASAKAIESSQVILVPKVFFREEIHRDPDLALRILAGMGNHLKFLVDTVEDLKLKQAESRVAQWLLRQHTKTNEHQTKPTNEIVIPMAKRLLASQLGITSETFSRVLYRFRKEKCIDVDGKTITILSLNQLLRYTTGEI